jgi:hypothetical protein
MIPMTVETKFLIGRTLITVGVAKEDPSEPPQYSAWFILKQLSFHASIVARIISGAPWPERGVGARRSQKLSHLYPRLFIDEQLWYAI